MEKKEVDIAIIGAGPGGYVAAIQAASEGKIVALIEKDFVGGTCLNVGCIPTKTLIASALTLHHIKQAKHFGIEVGPISFSYAKMKERKDGVVEKIRKSLEGLIASHKIFLIKGRAEFSSAKELKVVGESNVLLSFEKAIIATGSCPLDIPNLPCDHVKIFNSSSILELTSLPKKIAIVGGGYIGCEFASLFSELGVQVTIVEAMPSIIAAQGAFLSDTLTKAFTKQGIEIITNAFVEKVDTTSSSGVCLHIQGKPSIEADIVLVSIGRQIVSRGLGLEKVGVATTARGEIIVDEHMTTTTPHIYAIGDVTGKNLLAHVASHQGMVAAKNACGKKVSMHYHAVPAVIFTHPEIAMVGMGLEEAMQSGREISVGKFPFQALGKAIAARETEGFAQVIADKKTRLIIGAQIVGEGASSLIAEMTLAIANELTLDCIEETIHAHPTLAEAWLEASLLAKGTPIHFPPTKR